MILETNKLAKHKTHLLMQEHLLMQDEAKAHTVKLAYEMLKDKKQIRLLEPHHYHRIVPIWIQ